MFDIAIGGTALVVTMLLLFALVIGVILFLRHTFSSNDKNALAAKYADGNLPLTARNKYPEANPFQWRTVFLLSGLMLAFLTVVLAFSYTAYEDEIFIPEGAMELEDDMLIEPPRTAEPPPPPPPPPPPVIEEVPEEELTEEEEPEFVDQTIEEETTVEEPEVDDAPPPPPPPPPPPEPEVEEIFKVVEQMPRFNSSKCEGLGDKKEIEKCAQQEMLKFIYKNIKYPPIARENGVEGTVVVRFVVDKDGSVDEPEVLRDIGAGCGDEALRVVKMMPKWKPGKQRGRNVKVYFNLPVKFKLE